MISLLPFREELASAGRGPEAFVGRQPAARPRIGRLPPFFQARRPTGPWNNVVSGDPALSWPVGAQWGSQAAPHAAPGAVGGGPSPVLLQLCQVRGGPPQGS